MFASTAKEFFADEMPSSKFWRRKASDGKLQHHSGVCFVLDFYKQYLLAGSASIPKREEGVETQQV